MISPLWRRYDTHLPKYVLADLARYSSVDMRLGPCARRICAAYPINYKKRFRALGTGGRDTQPTKALLHICARDKIAPSGADMSPPIWRRYTFPHLAQIYVSPPSADMRYPDLAHSLAQICGLPIWRRYVTPSGADMLPPIWRSYVNLPISRRDAPFWRRYVIPIWRVL